MQMFRAAAKAFNKRNRKSREDRAPSLSELINTKGQIVHSIQSAGETTGDLH